MSRFLVVVFTIFALSICPNILRAQSKLDTLLCKNVDIESFEEYKEFLEFGCSLGCAIGWNFESTSILAPNGNNTYSPKNLGDINFQTAWIEGKKDYGIGEKIIINFDMTKEIKDLNFDGIHFINGYIKSKKLWRLNSRVKTFKLWQNNKPLFFIRLMDTDWPQEVSFNDKHRIYLNYSDKILLEIVEVYPGEKYSDTAITEINLYGAH